MKDIILCSHGLVLSTCSYLSSSSSSASSLLSLSTMESLTLCLSSSSSLLKPQKPPPNSLQIPLSFSSKLHPNQIPSLVSSISSKTPLKPYLPLPILLGFLSSSVLPSFASEIVADSSGSPSDKINIESILVAIDDFNNKNPFFVAGCTFVYLIVLPLVEEYLRKYKYVSAIDGFRRLRDDSRVQLLDIRDQKSVNFIGSPSLRILNKDVAQIPYSEGDEDGFLKNVMAKFADPKNVMKKY